LSQTEGLDRNAIANDSIILTTAKGGNNFFWLTTISRSLDIPRRELQESKGQLLA